MKMLCISGSPRGKQSNTFKLMEETLNAIKLHFTDAEAEYINLSDKDIRYCIGCGLCHRNLLQCPIKDDVSDILQKMLEADVIMFASPVYINHISAQLKALLDRSSPFIHCQMLLGKYGAAFATSGGGPHVMVLDYLEDYMISCGVQYVGGASGPMSEFDALKERARSLGTQIVEAVREGKKFPDQLAMMEVRRRFFKDAISLRKEQWAGEYGYWREKGWL
ncbi:flavodoxin family protein [Acetomicrobium sp. UBA5826]|uniref:flavodoxin family protein n=1 Tax=Acetomicrobium sp. UBA5826 TaxID=1946039 RepID=UPI00257DF99B|nr:flavodoxin family protein [Acetomicrobium sp. UBA5826]